MASESLHYGHLESFMGYSGGKNINKLGIYIEHGVNFAISEIQNQIINNNSVLIFQSDYKNKMIHKKNEFKPSFNIGPFVHYAKDYYSDTQIQKIKDSLGKTALLYPSHTYELSNLDRDIDAYIDCILSKIYDKYDTILISVYWNDIDDTLFEKLRRYKKIKLVSAGIRLDSLFLSRTKSLIKISDKVYGNEVGTYVGYAIAEGKEVQIIEIEDQLQDIGMTAEQMSLMNINKRLVVEALRDKNISVINKFWGLSDIITQDEMKTIFEVAEIILKESNYKKSRFDEVAMRIKEGAYFNEEKTEFIRKYMG